MAISALKLVHSVLEKKLKSDSVCIDATAGRGYDTAFLSSIATDGRVVAFDIQEEAVKSTKKLLEDKGLKGEVYLDSHENMGNYFEEETVDAIVFNLGYLPKGNHKIYTHFESTKTAIDAGLRLLKKGGIMAVSVYYGGDSGYDEKNALFPYLKSIDDDRYQVIVADFYNWTNDPPIPVFIIKNENE